MLEIAVFERLFRTLAGEKPFAKPPRAARERPGQRRDAGAVGIKFFLRAEKDILFQPLDRVFHGVAQRLYGLLAGQIAAHGLQRGWTVLGRIHHRIVPAFCANIFQQRVQKRPVALQRGQIPLEPRCFQRDAARRVCKPLRALHRLRGAL